MMPQPSTHRAYARHPAPVKVLRVNRDSSDILIVESNQLSPRAATIMGCAFIGVGLVTIWAGLRQPASGVPSWVPVFAGLFFMAGGGAVIVNFGTEGRTGPDGQLLPNTPLGIRLANLALALAFVGLLCAIFAWIGFGPGERQFSTTIATPFSKDPMADDETLGRWAFGGFSVLLALVFMTGLIKGLRTIRDRDS